MSGEVIAYRVKDTASGAPLLQVVERDVTVDEALAGPDAFGAQAVATEQAH